MAAPVHKAAGDLTPAWIGRAVTVLTNAGPLTATLSDFEMVDDQVALYMAGRRLIAAPQTTVSSDDVGLLGGAS